jgi:hypothetical protein
MFLIENFFVENFYCNKIISYETVYMKKMRIFLSQIFLVENVLLFQNNFLGKFG